MEPLVVHVNRGDHRALEPEVARHETPGPFVARLENHGEGCHVHLSLSGELAAVGTIEDTNPFLAPESVIEVAIDVDRAERPVSGTIELSTGYGQESVTIDVELTRNTASSPTTTTRVPETSGGTGRPPQSDGWNLELPSIDLGGGGNRNVEPGTIALIGVGAIAVGVAALAWLLLDGLAVKMAVIGVVATVFAAAVVVLAPGFD